MLAVLLVLVHLRRRRYHASGAPATRSSKKCRRHLERKDWAGAAGVLKEALARNPNNADYHNLYAYSLRKGPNPDMNLVFKHYNEALRLDPKHKGAHEYLGEAYLMVGNVAKAKEQLGQLDRLCLLQLHRVHRPEEVDRRVRSKEEVT